MPSPATATHPGITARHARIAVSALFFTNGALFANLVPRYPEIKQALGLDDVAYGVSVAAFPAGAIAVGLLAAMTIRRFGSANVAVIGTILTGLGLLAAASAPSGALFAAALFVAGASDALTDVAQNSHGLRVQRVYRRSIINSFHAIWSIGAVTGGLMAAAAIAVDVPLTVHLSVSTALFIVVAVAARRWCLPRTVGEAPVNNPGEAEASLHPKHGPRTILLLAALTLVAIAGAVGEDAGNSWATLYLGRSLGAAPALAPLGFIALIGAQFVGRMLADRFVDRFGVVVVTRVGGIVVAVGMGLALALPSVPGTIAGFAAVGLGVAPLIPSAMHAADEVPGLQRGTGLTVVSWLLRLGFLLSPPFVGFIAQTVDLRVGLLIAPAAGITAVLLAGSLRPRPTAGPVTARAASPRP